MLDFQKLHVSDDIKNVLNKYKVDFVYQAIHDRGDNIVGYEALMRPEGMDVQEFIRTMEEQGKLHDVELLSFFGATLGFRERNLSSKLTINSLPSESLTEEEVKEYYKCYRPFKNKMVVEILEYTEEKGWTWEKKQKYMKAYKGIELALDDFGSGHNDLQAVTYYRPDMIKLDRELIANVDKDEKRKSMLTELIRNMHDKFVQVLAEGVETMDEYNFLFGADVDYFQGYFLSDPA